VVELHLARLPHYIPLAVLGPDEPPNREHGDDGEDTTQYAALRDIARHLPEEVCVAHAHIKLRLR